MASIAQQTYTLPTPEGSLRLRVVAFMMRIALSATINNIVDAVSLRDLSVSEQTDIALKVTSIVDGLAKTMDEGTQRWHMSATFGDAVSPVMNGCTIRHSNVASQVVEVELTHNEGKVYFYDVTYMGRQIRSFSLDLSAELN